MGAETNLSPATNTPEVQVADTVLETETVSHGVIFGSHGTHKRHVTTAGVIFNEEK